MVGNGSPSEHLYIAQEIGVRLPVTGEVDGEKPSVVEAQKSSKWK